jgi:hypothetical protein
VNALKQNKIINFEIKQIGPESDRVLRFIGSDETADRDLDIIESTGWKTSEYVKNPVFLWCHDYRIPPIGKCINVEVVNKALVFDIKFPTISELSSDIENPSDHAKFVDTIYNMYKGGYLNATSVGFRGIKYKTRDDDAVLDKPEWQRGRRYIEQNLLELSAVPVPANPNALQQAKSEGLIDEISMKSFLMPENTEKGVSVFGCDDETAQKLLDLARTYVKDFNIEKKRIVIDGKEKDVFIESVKGECINFGFEHLENKEASIRIPLSLIKTGARLSTASKKALSDIHESLSKCNGDYTSVIEKLKTFMDGIQEPENEEEPKGTGHDSTKSPKSIDEVFEAFNQMTTQVFQRLDEFKTDYTARLEALRQRRDPDGLENPPSTNKGEINLDEIEVPTTATKAVNNEPNIKPEELQKLIKEAVENAVKTAKGKV